MQPAAVSPRLRAVLDLMVASAREEAGHHEYDGQVQDLSDDGVRRGLAALGGERLPDSHDDAHLTAHEVGRRIEFAELAFHRSNPLWHMTNLEVTCYDRAYAPESDRALARRRHLAAWPAAVDVAVTTLDRVPAPVARSLVEGVRGLAAEIPADLPETAPALAAHQRLVQHIEHLASTGSPEAAIGEGALARLMGGVEALTVDLGDLAVRADKEQARLAELLADSCARIRPGAPVAEVVADLLADHPSAEGVIAEAKELTAEVIAFTAERGLVSHLDGECVVGISPESRRWATAMLSWAAPGEPDTPTRYDITPPEPAWPKAEQDEWLSMFNRTSMPAITVHEVAPGHFAHSRALRHARGEVRRSLFGGAFVEGWAHYTEEMMLEEGFRADDPRYAAGVALEALCRVTRLACAIGLHTGAMDVAEATRRFQSHAHLSEAVARSEAQRGTFDPGYGMYTWGKWEILRTREQAQLAWGGAFTVRRFHDALLTLGSPPLGLLGTAVERG